MQALSRCPPTSPIDNRHAGAVPLAHCENVPLYSNAQSREKAVESSHEFAALSGPEPSMSLCRAPCTKSEDHLGRLNDSVGRILSGGPSAAQEVARIAERRELRGAFFRFVEQIEDRHAAAELLYSVIAAEGPPAYWVFRKRCVEFLLERSSTPLLTTFNILLCSNDPLIKDIAIKRISSFLSFPLSSEAREEVRALGTTGGRLLNVLLKEAPLVGEKPTWVSMYPRLVQSWILACSAAGVESGIGRQDLQKFDRNAHGPLNDWHIDKAVAPLTLFSVAWVLGFIRKALRS